MPSVEGDDDGAGYGVRGQQQRPWCVWLHRERLCSVWLLRLVAGKGARRAYADFFGTEGGLLSGIAIEITSEANREMHLLRGYLEKALILTY
jgi:hypothetical protein